MKKKQVKDYPIFLEESYNYHIAKSYIQKTLEIYNNNLPIELTEDNELELSFEDHLKAKIRVTRMFYLALTIYIMAKD